MKYLQTMKHYQQNEHIYIVNNLLSKHQWNVLPHCSISSLPVLSSPKLPLHLAFIHILYYINPVSTMLWSWFSSFSVLKTRTLDCHTKGKLESQPAKGKKCILHSPVAAALGLHARPLPHSLPPDQKRACSMHPSLCRAGHRWDTTTCLPGVQTGRMEGEMRDGTHVYIAGSRLSRMTTYWKSTASSSTWPVVQKGAHLPWSDMGNNLLGVNFNT